MYRDAEIIVETYYRCSNCKREVYTCNDCKNMFEASSIIFCSSGLHLCEMCVESRYNRMDKQREITKKEELNKNKK